MSVWTWSDPLGLGAFILAVALAITLLCWSIKLLASIASNPPAPRSRSRRR